MKAAAKFASLLVAAALSLFLLSVGLPLAQPALASSSASASGPFDTSTVRVEIVVRDVTGSRSYDLITTNDGATRRLESGSRVALQARPKPTQPGVVPISSVQYQEVGFSAEVTVRQTGAQEYRVQARLEDSVVNREAEGPLPQIDHHTQELQALLGLGEALEATQVVGSDANGYSVTIALHKAAR